MKSEDLKYIEAWDFAKYLEQIQEAVLEGYRLRSNNIHTYPQHINGRYWVTMVKESVAPVKGTVKQPEVVKEPATPAPAADSTAEVQEAQGSEKTTRKKAK